MSGTLVRPRHCPVCRRRTRQERAVLGWGCFDLFLLAFTFGLWLVPKFYFHWALDRWHCVECGTPF